MRHRPGVLSIMKGLLSVPEADKVCTCRRHTVPVTREAEIARETKFYMVDGPQHGVVI